MQEQHVTHKQMSKLQTLLLQCWVFPSNWRMDDLNQETVFRANLPFYFCAESDSSS